MPGWGSNPQPWPVEPMLSAEPPSRGSPELYGARRGGKGLSATGGGARERGGGGAEPAGCPGGGPGSDGSARGRLESVKSAPPPPWSLCSPAWAMENGAVYRPTTEEDPGPARGARSGLAAYCHLGRLPLPRRVLKGLQLVSPGRGGRGGRGGAPVLGPGPGPSACGLGRPPSRLSSARWFRKRRFHTPVPAAATPPAGRPLAPRWVPDGDGGPLNE